MQQSQHPGRRRRHPRHPKTARVFPLLALWLALALAAAVQPAAAAIQDSEVLESDLDATPEPPDELEQLWLEASRKCASLEQIQSIPLFTDLIDRLEERHLASELFEEQKSWLTGSLFCRAEARFNRRKIDEARTDLGRILELDPGFAVDSAKSSARLTTMLEEIRAATVGRIALVAVEPPAVVSLDGVELREIPQEPLAVLAGTHTVVATRPGFAPFEQEIEVPAAETATLELALERTSAVFQLELAPCGAKVALGGVTVGEATPLAGFAGIDDDATEELGTPCGLVLAGIDTGEHVLTVSSPGYRTAEAKVEVAELTDYRLPPVSLVTTSGVVLVEGVPPGVQFTLDGDIETGSAGGAPVRFELPTGLHEVIVDLGTVGRFDESFELADREEKTVRVDFAPALSYLATVGGDERGQSQLESWLFEAFDGVDGLRLRETECDAAALLAEHGLTAEALRELAAARPIRDKPWDETRLRDELDEGCAASLYFLGVLSEDPLAVEADLWIWSAAPGPVGPEVRRIELPPGPRLQTLLSGLGAELRLSRNWIGSRAVDSELAQGPVVVAVVPGGPAQSAGLQTGDEILALGGEGVSSNRQLEARVDSAPRGSTLEVRYRRGPVEGEASIELATTPTVSHLLAGDSLPGAVSAQLALLPWTGGTPGEDWVLELNRAAVLMAAGEWALAARELAGISAPSGPGLGQATVDYLLARALLATGSEAYRDRAMAALARAAESELARLDSHDGALVAPRARIRLEELTAPSASRP